MYVWRSTEYIKKRKVSVYIYMADGAKKLNLCLQLQCWADRRASVTFSSYWRPCCQNNGDGIDPVEFRFRRPGFANIVVFCVCASPELWTAWRHPNSCIRLAKYTDLEV